MICLANYGLNTIIVKQGEELLKKLKTQCWFFDDRDKMNFKNWLFVFCTLKQSVRKLVVACRNIDNYIIDHSFGMLAVSFQFLTWCTNSAEDLVFLYLSQLL